MHIFVKCLLDVNERKCSFRFTFSANGTDRREEEKSEEKKKRQNQFEIGTNCRTKKNVNAKKKLRAYKYRTLTQNTLTHLLNA